MLFSSISKYKRSCRIHILFCYCIFLIFLVKKRNEPLVRDIRMSIGYYFPNNNPNNVNIYLNILLIFFYEFYQKLTTLIV